MITVREDWNGIKVGFRAGSMEVIGPVFSRGPLNGSKKFSCLCRCDCGRLVVQPVTRLKSGEANRCHQCAVEQSAYLQTTHGGAAGGVREPLYVVWRSMKTRCNGASKQHQLRYFLRGIRVCDEWVNDFAAFRAWANSNGYRKGLHIDRINNDGNYCPENCRFVEPKANSRNRACVVQVTAFGETKSAPEWIEDARCAVRYRTLKERLALGWEPEKAITQPAQARTARA